MTKKKSAQPSSKPPHRAPPKTLLTVATGGARGKPAITQLTYAQIKARQQARCAQRDDT